MAGKVVLNVKDDGLFDGRFVFSEPSYCTVGRAKDCQLRVPGDPKFFDVSRHHCLLRIEPPEIHIRDLGSRNGTFVNGAKIGQRKGESLPDASPPNSYPEWVVHDGDEIRIGHVTICVQVCSDTGSFNAKVIGPLPTPATQQ